jgi:hypothetical protein
MSLIHFTAGALSKGSKPLCGGGVAGFFRHLGADLQLLFAKNLPWQLSVPSEVPGLDASGVASVVSKAKRRHKLLIVRQAVHKQMIRETLGERFGILLLLLGPITVPVAILAGVVWLACLFARPEIANWLNPFFWVSLF